MISIEDRTEWAKAEAKARQMKARVRMIKFGSYEVPSSDPDHDPYTVEFTKTTTGHWAASCTCPAHVGPATLTEEERKTYKPKRCWHIPTAYHCHRIQVNIRQQVRAATQEEEAAPATELPICVDCGEPANAWTGEVWLCWTHVQERAANELPQETANAIEAEADRDAYEEMCARDREAVFG